MTQAAGVGMLADRRAVVFDLDGTLIDSERAICEAASLAFSEIGLLVTPLQVADHLGAPLDELYALFVGDGDPARRAQFTPERSMNQQNIPRPQAEEFIARYIAHHDAHHERFPPPLPGVHG